MYRLAPAVAMAFETSITAAIDMIEVLDYEVSESLAKDLVIPRGATRYRAEAIVIAHHVASAIAEAAD